jgi:hypothetical protein
MFKLVDTVPNQLQVGSEPAVPHPKSCVAYKSRNGNRPQKLIGSRIINTFVQPNGSPMPTLFNRKKPKHKTQATGLVSRSRKNPTTLQRNRQLKKRMSIFLGITQERPTRFTMTSKLELDDLYGNNDVIQQRYAK